MSLWLKTNLVPLCAVGIPLIITAFVAFNNLSDSLAHISFEVTAIKKDVATLPLLETELHDIALRTSALEINASQQAYLTHDIQRLTERVAVLEALNQR